MAVEIQHAEAEGRGAFFVERDGARIAEMTYSRAGEDQVIIDHTEVHEVLRGKGVARMLLDRAVGWARESGTTIRATCAYARGQFEKDASIGDVWAR